MYMISRLSPAHPGFQERKEAAPETPRKKEYVQVTLLPGGSGRQVRHPKSPSFKYSIRAAITEGKGMSSGQAGPPW
jgi:hypothetical protein